MHSKLKPGIAKSAIDAQIEKFVSDQEENPFPMVDRYIAVKNEAGEVYRVIVADGIHEAIEADQFLVSLGCTEEPTSQYNSLFRVPGASA